MTQCLYSCNQTKEVKCEMYIKVGAVRFCLHHRWMFVFAAEVKIVVLQYMSSVVAERVRVSCTNRAALKP